MLAWSGVSIYYGCMEKHKKPTFDYDTLLERLQLEALKVGDVVTIVVGAGDDAWTYKFRVMEMHGRWPMGMLCAAAPNGTVTEEFEFTLHGTGRWTTPNQNPCQSPMLERGFTSYWDSVRVGDYMAGKFAGQPERAVFDNPGQEVSAISVAAEPAAG